MAKCVIQSAWTNTQKPNDYNPLHTHTHFSNKALNPDLSCVGYLKIPKMIPYNHSKEHHQVGGWIEFCEGSENIFNNANYLWTTHFGRLLFISSKYETYSLSFC